MIIILLYVLNIKIKNYGMKIKMNLKKIKLLIMFMNII